MYVILYKTWGGVKEDNRVSEKGVIFRDRRLTRL